MPAGRAVATPTSIPAPSVMRPGTNSRGGSNRMCYIRFQFLPQPFGNRFAVVDQLIGGHAAAHFDAMARTRSDPYRHGSTCPASLAGTAPVSVQPPTASVPLRDRRPPLAQTGSYVVIVDQVPFVCWSTGASATSLQYCA